MRRSLAAAEAMADGQVDVHPTYIVYKWFIIHILIHIYIYINIK
jgi:hypothetical protein